MFITELKEYTPVSRIQHNRNISKLYDTAKAMGIKYDRVMKNNKYSNDIFTVYYLCKIDYKNMHYIPVACINIVRYMDSILYILESK